MRKPSLLFVTVAISAVAFVAAFAIGAATAETKSYNLTGFDRIEVSAGLDVVLKQGPHDVKVEQADGKFDQIDVYVRGDTLRISREGHSGWWGKSRRYLVTVTAPDIRAIEASSGSDVEGRNLSLKDLRVHVSSGADVELSGSCNELKVSVSSGSDFDGEELACDTVRASASSGADAVAMARSLATGDASSGGDITFHGKPASFEKSTSSGGSVRSL